MKNFNFMKRSSIIEIKVLNIFNFIKFYYHFLYYLIYIDVKLLVDE
jgi:hypothetical protein